METLEDRIERMWRVWARDNGYVLAKRSDIEYLAQPTMGLPGGADPHEFAMEATELNARRALQTCIRFARKILDENP